MPGRRCGVVELTLFQSRQDHGNLGFVMIAADSVGGHWLAFEPSDLVELERLRESVQ